MKMMVDVTPLKQRGIAARTSLSGRNFGARRARVDRRVLPATTVGSSMAKHRARVRLAALGPLVGVCARRVSITIRTTLAVGVKKTSTPTPMVTAWQIVAEVVNISQQTRTRAKTAQLGMTRVRR